MQISQIITLTIVIIFGIIIISIIIYTKKNNIHFFSSTTSSSSPATPATNDSSNVFKYIIIIGVVIIVLALILITMKGCVSCSEIPYKMMNTELAKQANQPYQIQPKSNLFPSLQETKLIFSKKLPKGQIQNVTYIRAKKGQEAYFRIKTEKPCTIIQWRIRDDTGVPSSWWTLKPGVNKDKDQYTFWTGTLQVKTTNSDDIVKVYIIK